RTSKRTGGRGPQEITVDMVAGSGRFVPSASPLSPLTVLLWVLPLAAIVAGGWIIVARTRRRVRIRQDVLSDAIRRRVRATIIHPPATMAASGSTHSSTVSGVSGGS
ncbi:hypothetical protein DCJ39_24560, partial [Salmonella enterica subsp. enterica serovar Kentucky]|nr:hypothetical protein [Salmonella enterica subsp. enterica serovar Kentucky]